MVIPRTWHSGVWRRRRKVPSCQNSLYFQPLFHAISHKTRSWYTTQCPSRRHGVGTSPSDPGPSTRESCLAYGACWFGHLGQAELPFPLLPTHKGCDASCEPQVFPVAGSTLLWCQLQDGMFFPYELYNWLWRRVLHSFLCLSYWKFPLGEGGESLMGSRQ